MDLGYPIGTGIFAVLFACAVHRQIAARPFHPALYWTTIIASTMLGTTLADVADHSLGIGYTGGTTILLALLATCLWLWHRTLGSIAIGTVSTPKAELFYWVTIMLSQTLGTALGDWTADTAGLGYLGAASILGGAIALVAVACFRMSISHTLLFWAAFVLTRPPGAVLGNFLGEPVSHGGLELSRYAASAVLLAFIAACVAFVRQGGRSEGH
jgi:uncharacterized membrane-anchored protein